MSDWLDEDDVYPTEAALEKIKNWSYTDKAGCFAFMKDIWQYAESGYWNEHQDIHMFRKDKQPPVTLYNISTCGWSGNESIIAALKENIIIWQTTWVQSIRGGHYIFEVLNNENA